MKFSRLVMLILYTLTIVLLTYFLWWHYQLGITRYFDVDEFAHLHWASLIVQGQRPYIDFFSFFPPGFWWFLAPIVKLSWGGVGPFIAARTTMFVIFIGLCAVSAAILKELRGKSWTILLVPLFLSFLPLPFDKFLEIRPDLLATLLTMLGMYLQLRGPNFWAGVLYGLSIVVLTKMIPPVALAIIIGGFAMRSRVLPMMYGFMTAIGLFFIWILTLGDFPLVFYSLTKLPLEANKIAQTFFMSPDLFFYPNEIFYGLPGISSGLIVNHSIWIVGLLFGTYRLFTPFSFGKRGVWKEILVAGTFVAHIALYVLFFPLKHTQYLIPIAPFVAIYVADFVGSIRKSVRTLLVFVLLFVLYSTFHSVNRPKLAWTNNDTLSELSTIYNIIPQGSYVLDLEGPILYGRNPYYVCCLPFGQFSQYLSRPLPSLAQSLEKANTQYIYNGPLNRFAQLSRDDQAYINANFRQSEVSPLLLVRR